MAEQTVTLEFMQAMMERILDGQRTIRGDIAELRADAIEIKERLAFLEGGYASLSRRVDRIGGDVDLIKRRLSLAEA
jgi:hypothetical protein